MAVPRLGLDGRKRVLGQIHPKALSDASVVNVPLLYIFEFLILWHVAMSCWEARNNIIPRTVNTPILSPLSHMPASGRDLCLPGLSQCRDASPFLLRFPEQPAKGCRSGIRPLGNSFPSVQRKVTAEVNAVGSPVPWNKHSFHLECHVRRLTVDSGQDAPAFALSQRGWPLGNHGRPECLQHSLGEARAWARHQRC